MYLSFTFSPKIADDATLLLQPILQLDLTQKVKIPAK